MMRTARRWLYGLGLNVTRPTTGDHQLLELICALHPKNCGIELIRVGGRGDGAYLIPNDLEGIEFCFSPGVSTISRFEDDLADRNIHSFLADYSVEGPSVQRPEFTFDKMFLGATDSANYFTLQTWKDKYLEGYAGDLILQMDIEGFEYQVIANVNRSLLGQFRILAIEFHYLDRLFDPFGFQLLSATFQKLLEQFHVVHIHPNNRCGAVTNGRIEIPKTMEFTFLNKKRVPKCQPQLVFPHPLDEDNEEGAPMHLPRCWYSER